mmetsp:Transcript_39851/g.98547  ORF Transcript_39851/g.98547 Transcript_39851/m.98547 type:complete len:222 (-) Transcript_39851:530-1195(-)
MGGPGGGGGGGRGGAAASVAAAAARGGGGAEPAGGAPRAAARAAAAPSAPRRRRRLARHPRHYHGLGRRSKQHSLSHRRHRRSHCHTHSHSHRHHRCSHRRGSRASPLRAPSARRPLLSEAQPGQGRPGWLHAAEELRLARPLPPPLRRPAAHLPRRARWKTVSASLVPRDWRLAGTARRGPGQARGRTERALRQAVAVTVTAGRGAGRASSVERQGVTVS